MARERGYLELPARACSLNVDELRERAARARSSIITTGSQGEPTSALTRMANGDHQHVADRRTATRSSCRHRRSPATRRWSTAPSTTSSGSARSVLYNRVADVHVRGHAAQEELKIIQALVKPKYFVPIHGEYRHLVLHAQPGARRWASTTDNAIVLIDGDVLELDGETAPARRARSRPTTSTSTASASATSTTSCCATASTSRRTAWWW